jgi:hypothetical protein
MFSSYFMNFSSVKRGKGRANEKEKENNIWE